MRWALLVVLAVAAVLRLWNVDAVGISHWDAGSYTAGPYGVGPYGKAYILPFYAPPLVPTLCWLAFEAIARVDTAAIVLMAFMGVAGVWAVFALGRALYGPGVALVAAAALAGTEFHVIFSRQPVTDGTYTLLFTLALLSLWKAWWQGERYAYLTAGAWTGACLLTKYHGFFPLVAFGGVLLLLPLARDRRLAPDGALLRGLKGLVLAGLVATIPLAWLVLDIHLNIGIDEFRANRSQWMPELGPWLIPQVGGYVARCLGEWVAWPVLGLALVGYVVMALRRRTADLALLVWTGLFLATLPLYANYPRLLLPLLPPLALAAGLGACTLGSALRRRADGGPGPMAPLLLAALVLAIGAWDGRDALDVSDRGYARAVEWLSTQPADPLPDIFLTQHAILFYAGGGRAGDVAPGDRIPTAHGFLTYDEPGALEVLRRGEFRFLVSDLRALTLPAGFREALVDRELNLQRAKTIPNPLPEPFVVNLEGFAGLDALRRTGDDSAAAVEYREALTHLFIWRHRPGPGDR